MDAMEIERAHLVGNSMGGRVALELALDAPERVSSLSLLAPALAFRRRRELVPLVRLLRPELAAIPHPLRARRSGRASGRCSRDPSASTRGRRRRLRGVSAHVPIALGEGRLLRRAAQHLPRRALRGARILDAARGARPPALFVWGDSDGLVPAAFSRHVAEALPGARQVVLAECGHVPQVELPSARTA